MTLIIGYLMGIVLLISIYIRIVNFLYINIFEKSGILMYIFTFIFAIPIILIGMILSIKKIQ